MCLYIYGILEVFSKLYHFMCLSEQLLNLLSTAQAREPRDSGGILSALTGTLASLIIGRESPQPNEASPHQPLPPLLPHTLNQNQDQRILHQRVMCSCI